MIKTCLAVGVLLAQTAWCCTKTYAPLERRGSTQRRLVLALDGQGQAMLREGAETLWALNSVGEPIFAPDDRWVALATDADVVIVETTKGAVPHHVDLVKLLTDDERQRVTLTTCGLQWFKHWAATTKGLEVTVNQSGQTPPTARGAEGVVFVITLDGRATRPAAPNVTDLVARWSGPASPARAEVMAGLLRASASASDTEVAALAPFVRKVVATKDVTPEEAEAAATLIGRLNAGDQAGAVDAALAHRGIEVALLTGLQHFALGQTVAERVFNDPTRSAAARAAAVDVATNSGTRPFSPLFGAALADPSPAVREAAATAAGHGRQCDPALLKKVVTLLGAENAKPSQAPDRPDAHEHIVEAGGGLVRFCLDSMTDPTVADAIAHAVTEGARLDPESTVAPLAYLEAARSAEGRSEPDARTLLDLAESACATQRPFFLVVCTNQLAQWQLLRALQRNDAAAARAQLARIVPRPNSTQLPDLTVNDLGRPLPRPLKEISVKAFVKAATGQLDDATLKPSK